MKKIVLLFTILCASALNGMETKRGVWDYLPQEIQSVIIKKALETSNNLDEAINAIERISTLHGAQFDKLFSKHKDFTVLVHMLANKFDLTSQDVAKKFETPISEHYITLGNNLISAIRNFDSTFENIKQIVMQGADVNFSIATEETVLVPLYLAVCALKTECVGLLLDLKANPHFKHPKMKWSVLEILDLGLISVRHHRDRQDLALYYRAYETMERYFKAALEKNNL